MAGRGQQAAACGRAVIYAVAAIIAAWNLAPHLMVWTRPGVPAQAKRHASRDLLVASGRGMLALLPDLLAPIVMLLVLPFVPRKAEHLPGLFVWWDNDVSINGDQREGGETYYAPGHDRRSFWARWVWLGWRNRASRLSQMLGHRWHPGEYGDWQSWGDPRTGRDHAGWSLNRRGSRWQMYLTAQLPLGFCFRLNYGFKVWAGEGDHRPVANVVNIAASILRWRGTKP